jgi:hypothetical protein
VAVLRVDDGGETLERGERLFELVVVATAALEVFLCPFDERIVLVFG